MRLAILPLLLLAACATPRQQCEQAATRDYRIVTHLIEETRQNIARGYAIRSEQRVSPTLSFCAGGIHDDHFGASYCSDVATYTVERPVAIDPAAERRKLRTLLERRRRLAIEAEVALADCAARLPAPAEG